MSQLEGDLRSGSVEHSTLLSAIDTTSFSLNALLRTIETNPSEVVSGGQLTEFYELELGHKQFSQAVFDELDDYINSQAIEQLRAFFTNEVKSQASEIFEKLDNEFVVGNGKDSILGELLDYFDLFSTRGDAFSAQLFICLLSHVLGQGRMVNIGAII